MNKRYLIGIDIGGTKVAAGLVDHEGRIIYKTRVPMVASEDAATGFACVKSAIADVLAAQPDLAKSIVGVGTCSPGPLDPKTGIVLNPPNLPCWRNFHLADSIEQAFNINARVDNDANAAALAEAIWGSGLGYSNVFYATLGTGIGTGIVFNQRIYYGRTGSAAEGGHMSIDYNGPKCGCGKRGCIEALCSGPAIAQRAHAKLRQGRKSRIIDLTGAVEMVRAEHVGEAFRMGDEVASEVLRETADLLAVWLGNIVDLLEPDVIVIGGGVSELMSDWLSYIQEQLPKWSINQRCREIPIVPARYGTDAGIVGAAALMTITQTRGAAPAGLAT